MTYKKLFLLAQQVGYDKSYLNNGQIESITYYTDDNLHEQDILLSITLINKWLRDEFKIHINVMNQVDHWELMFTWFGTNNNIKELDKVSRMRFDVYEDCLLKGIYEILNFLKK